MKSLLKNIVIIIVVGAILYIGYNFFFAGGGVALEIGSETNEGEILTQEFLVRLGELESIDFSRELFEDPRFRSLSSFSTSPESADVGRSNPFSP